MNYMFANEECSSGCESGWTLYLDHSPIPADSSHDKRNRIFTEAKRSKREEPRRQQEVEEDEDLSMVSDASSGPPHLHEQEGYGGSDNNGCSHRYTLDDMLPINSLNKKKNRENPRRNKLAQVQPSSLLDDTASSPFFDFSNKSFSATRSQPSVENNMLEYSQGYSTTQFEVRQPYQQHYDFFQSSQPDNQLQQQNQW